MTEHLGADAGTLQVAWRHARVVAADEQDLVEGDFVAFSGRESTDLDGLSLCDPELLAAALDNGVHAQTS